MLFVKKTFFFYLLTSSFICNFIHAGGTFSSPKNQAVAPTPLYLEEAYINECHRTAVTKNGKLPIENFELLVEYIETNESPSFNAIISVLITLEKAKVKGIVERQQQPLVIKACNALLLHRESHFKDRIDAILKKFSMSE